MNLSEAQRRQNAVSGEKEEPLSATSTLKRVQCAALQIGPAKNPSDGACPHAD